MRPLKVPRLSRTAQAAWVVAVMLGAVRLYQATRGGLFGVDFSAYWSAGRDALHHRSPYAAGAFLYPPGSLIAFVPMSLLPLKISRLVMLLIDAVSTIAALWIVLRRLGVSGSSTIVPLALIATESFEPALVNLEYLNINPVILLLLVLVADAILADRWIRAGIILGISLTLKPIAAPALLVFVCARHWKAIVASLGVVVALCAPVLLVLANRGDFFRTTLTDLLKGHTDFTRYSVSLSGAARRADFPGPVVTAVEVVAFALTAMAVWWIWSHRPDPVRPFEAVGVAMLGGLIAAPFSLNYYPILVLPLIICAAKQGLAAHPIAWVGLFLVGSTESLVSKSWSESYAAEFTADRILLGLVVTGVGVALAARTPDRHAT